MVDEVEGLTEEQVKAARDGYIPLDRLNEATGKLRDENSQMRETLASLEATVQALKTSPQQNQPAQEPQQKREYSRAELRQFVESGEISQQQADDYWDMQQEAKFDRKLKAEISKIQKESSEQASLGDLRNTISKFSEIIPELTENGSEDREKVRKEFQRLTRVTGVPKPESRQDFELQVIALENVYGSPENARKRRQQQSKPSDDNLMEETPSHEEMPKSASNSKVLKSLNARQKAHYQKQISNGVYKDWKAVEAELTWRDKQK
jgi:hypothetical protein